MIESLELTTECIEDNATIESLLENAGEDGHLGLEAIFEMFPEAETNAELLPHMIDALENEGVQIDGAPGDAFRPDADDDHLVDAPELRAALDTVDLSVLQTNDPIDLYMAEMGQVPLLT